MDVVAGSAIFIYERRKIGSVDETISITGRLSSPPEMAGLPSPVPPYSLSFLFPCITTGERCLSLFPQKLTKEGRDERWLVWFRRRKYRSIDGSPEIFISNSIFFPTKNTIFYTTYIILEFVGRSFPCLGSRTATGFTVMKNRACNHERVVPRLASKNHEIYYRPPR